MQISHLGMDYTRCDGKACLTIADLVGGIFIELTRPVFVILVVIKLVILVTQKIRRKI